MKKELFAICMLSSSVLFAAEYFVAPGGSDNNPGSMEKPFRSIGKAVKCVSPGDVVTVRGGVYHEMLNIAVKGTAEKPVVFRGATGETAIVTGGYPVTTPWSKTTGRRFIWENTSPYAIHMLWERRRMNRYLELTSLDMLDRQPGAFVLNRESGKMYIHPLEGADPNFIGVVIVPWYSGDGKNSYDVTCTGSVPLPLPVHTDPTGFYRFNKGFFITGEYVTVENFTVMYFPGQGIRVNLPGKNCTIKNNTVLGTTCGIMCYWGAGTRILGNRLLRNAGTGIALEGRGSNALVENNFLFNNGSCYQSRVEETASNGKIFNISHYGSYNGADFRYNLVIADEPERRDCNETMRCKPGVSGHSEQTGNVYVGGGVELYAIKSMDNISNNTMIDGKYIFGKFANGELYTPQRFENNLIVDDNTDVLFADEAHYDYRLRKNSPLQGKGAFPNSDGFLHVKNTAELQTALDKAGNGFTIYLEPGTYSGQASFSGKAILCLVNSEKRKVVFDKFSFTGAAGKLTFDGLIFKNCRFKLGSPAFFKRCVFDTSIMQDAANAVLEKCTILASELKSDKLTLRDTLLVGGTPKITASSVIKENNASIDKIDSEYRLPPDSPLAYAAIDCGAIGGRPAPEEKKPFVVENLTATPLSPDRVRITCYTPFEYWSAISVRGEGIKPRYISQQNYKSTTVEFILNDLKPDTEYKIQIYFYSPKCREAVANKELTFRTLDKVVNKPKLISVASGDSLKDALQRVRQGDTVVVAPGVYTGGFRIDVDDITLKSEIPGKAELSAAHIYSLILVLDKVKNVTIEGFRFGGVVYSGSYRSISAGSCRNITVRNCYFDRVRNRGKLRCSNLQLVANGIDGLSVSNCIFNSGFMGIWAYPAKNIKIFNNTFWGIGINAIHVGCEKGDKVEIFNNIFADVVSNHTSPAVTVAEPGKHIYCDYNLYWHTDIAPKQRIFGFGRAKKGNPYSAPWNAILKNQAITLSDARERFGIEEHGIFADPKFVDFEFFTLKPDSPAKGKGANIK